MTPASRLAAEPGTIADVASRRRRRGAASSRSRTTAPTSTASPRSPTRARSRACCATRSSGCCGSTTWRCRARGAPTPACTRGVRWCRSRSTASRHRPRACRPRGEPPARTRGGGAHGGAGRRATSTPAIPRRWRAYRYTIVNRPAPDPFLARTAWWVPEPLDLSLLRLGADPFLGEHDFATFCRKGPAGSTTVRRVLDVALARPRRRRAALRHHRHRVLLADGALDRGHARRRRRGQDPPR